MRGEPAFAADIRALFSTRGAALVDIPVLQPADPFLDMAGEDLRRRIFLTESETGEQLCLRPEFTIPVCLDHIAGPQATPRRYAYLGTVFRQRRQGASEFLQAGIEDIGDPATADADARLIADAHALLRRVLPGVTLAATLGDQAVFEAVLAALGLPRGWQKRLARAFGAPGLLDAALHDLARPPARDAGAGLSDEAQTVAAVQAAMEAAGISPSAGRTPQEIARRLAEKAELGRTSLSAEALAALKAFLAIDVPLALAADTLARFAAGAGLALGPALEIFAARAAALAGHAPEAMTIRYDAGFGRPLDYYTGLVFEIVAQGGSGQPLAGGGRYDRLLTLLGARSRTPGVGFSVWLDRIEAAGGRP